MYNFYKVTHIFFFILEAILRNVQVDDYENLAADLIPLESLFPFTEESSGKII